MTLTNRVLPPDAPDDLVVKQFTDELRKTLDAQPTPDGIISLASLQPLCAHISSLIRRYSTRDQNLRFRLINTFVASIRGSDFGTNTHDLEITMKGVMAELARPIESVQSSALLDTGTISKVKKVIG